MGGRRKDVGKQAVELAGFVCAAVGLGLVGFALLGVAFGAGVGLFMAALALVAIGNS